MRKKRMQISLIITESCPLACNYCYEIHKENQKMTFEKAKFSVQGVQTRLKRNDRFEISDRVVN